MRATVGSLDPAVYWRRRAVVGGAVIVVVVLLVVLFSGGSSGSSGSSATPGNAPHRTNAAGSTSTGTNRTAAQPAPAARAPHSPPADARGLPTPTTSAPGQGSSSPVPSASAVLTPSAAPSGACTTGQLAVLAGTDAPSYRVGSTPVLTLTVRNSSAASCTVDVGGSQRELLVSSGTAHTWSSKDCAPATGSARTALAPGKQLSYPVTWSGKRSQPGCTGDRTVATAGTYRLVARLGEQSSADVVFRLT